MAHAFGGDWTEVKLARLSKYLTAYRTIFTNNEKARHFTTWYVDAFAGTGSRSLAETSTWDLGLTEDVYEDADTSGYRDGSARIALELDSPFDKYLFIEKSKTKADELRALIEKNYALLMPRCEFRKEDANAALCAWCNERDWTKERAVVFLDPYGMQVEWSTIEALAATKAIDLWYLFPLVARLLKRDGRIEEAWQKRLDLLFGTSDWRSRFYQLQTLQSLFGETETINRDVTVENTQEFIQERLRTCFAAVAKGLVLKNSKASPLYSLCFAAANERGAKVALKIAQSILDD
jgi:three-Cys-motif partner protein